jgi:hypothetical protein
MNLEKIILEELNKIALDQKIDNSFKNDQEIKKLTELDALLPVPAPVEPSSLTRVATSNKLARQWWKDEWAGTAHTLAWNKGMSAAAEIVWRAFVYLPERAHQKTGVSPRILQDFGVRQKEVVTQIRKYMEENFCLENSMEVSNTSTQSLAKKLKEIMIENFPGLDNDKYFYDFETDSGGVIKALHKIIKQWPAGKLQERGWGTMPGHTGGPSKKLRTACRAAAQTKYPDDLLRQLMVAVLYTPFSTGAVPGAPVHRFNPAKYRDIWQMIDSHKEATVFNSPKYFNIWREETLASQEEVKKARWRKSLEFVGEASMYTFFGAKVIGLLFRIPKLLQFVKSSTSLVPKMARAKKTLDRWDTRLLIPQLAVLADEWFIKTDINMKKIISNLEDIMKQLPKSFEEFNGRGQAAMQKVALYRTIDNIEKATVVAATAIYSGSMRKLQLDFGVAAVTNDSALGLTSLKDRVNLFTGPRPEVSEEEQRIAYSEFRRAVGLAIKELTKALNLSTKKRENIKVSLPRDWRVAPSRGNAEEPEKTIPGPPANFSQTDLFENVGDSDAIAGTRFKFSMFASKDKGAAQLPPAAVKKNIKKLAIYIAEIENEFGGNLKIISGYRTAAHNAFVGGAEASQHLFGKAVDLKPGSGDDASLRLYVAISKLIDNKTIPEGGLGWYGEGKFVHYDFRGNRERWMPKKWGAEKKQAQELLLKKALGAPRSEISLMSRGGDETENVEAIVSAKVIFKDQKKDSSKNTCAGSESLVGSRALQVALAYVLKGGSICDFKKESKFGWGSGDELWRLVNKMLRDVKPGGGISNDLEISKNIKQNIWRNFLYDYATGAPRQATKDVESNIFDSTSTIYGLNIGMLANTSYNEPGKRGKVYNFGYIQADRRGHSFSYISDTETFSRSGGLEDLADGFRLFILGPKKARAMHRPADLETSLRAGLKGLEMRLKVFQKILGISSLRDRYAVDADQTRVYKVTLKMLSGLIQRLKALRNALDLFSKTPNVATLRALQEAGYFISILARTVDNDSGR